MEEAITLTEKEVLALARAMQWRLDMITETHPDRKPLQSILEKVSVYQLLQIEALLEKVRAGGDVGEGWGYPV